MSYLSDEFELIQLSLAHWERITDSYRRHWVHDRCLQRSEVPFIVLEGTEAAWVFTPGNGDPRAKRRRKNHKWKQNLPTANWIKVLPSQREAAKLGQKECEGTHGWSQRCQHLLPHRRCQRGQVIKALEDHCKDVGFGFCPEWDGATGDFCAEKGPNLMLWIKPICSHFWEMTAGKISIDIVWPLRKLLRWSWWDKGGNLRKWARADGKKGLNSASILKVQPTGFPSRYKCERKHGQGDKVYGL